MGVLKRRSRGQVYIFLALLLLFVPAGEGGSQENGSGPATTFEGGDCWAQLAEIEGVDCGWVRVPLRWEAPAKRPISLPVVVFRPLEADPSLAPVVYLAGGPGQGGLGPEGAWLKGWRDKADRFFPGRKLVVFDQRGVGLGDPRLDCPEIFDPKTRWEISNGPDDFGDVEARWWAAVSGCHRRLTAEGWDLSAFNSRQSAGDIEALRKALGLGKVILFGASYGSRLALTFLRHFPAALSALILDSPLPPEAIHLDAAQAAFGPPLERLFRACADHEGCSEAYPALQENFLSLLQRLAKTPLILKIKSATDSRPLYLRADHLTFLDVVFLQMYSPDAVSKIPALIDALSRGRTEGFKATAERAVAWNFVEFLSMGLFHSVTCHDAADTWKTPPDQAAFGDYPYLADYLSYRHKTSVCHRWPVGSASAEESGKVESDIPSLLFSGAFDPTTTTELAEVTAEGLTRSHLFVFPAGAHGSLFRESCAEDILAAFLSDPDRRPDPDCLTRLPKPSFVTPGKD